MNRLTRLQKNLLFAAVLLLAAVVLFWALRGRKQGEALVAVADFGDGITETIPLDKDYDYLYDVGDYVVHLRLNTARCSSLQPARMLKKYTSNKNTINFENRDEERALHPCFR